MLIGRLPILSILSILIYVCLIQQKKPKVDKRELPENNKFYCDTCDRGYKDEDKFELHIQDHKQVQACH